MSPSMGSGLSSRRCAGSPSRLTSECSRSSREYRIPTTRSTCLSTATRASRTVSSTNATRPLLADVLTLRADWVPRVSAFLVELTPERIESTVECQSTDWPFTESFHVGQCLATVVNEEWHHRNFAERDLDRLIAVTQGAV